MEGATPNQLLLNAIQGLQGTMEGALERVTSLEAVRSRSRSPSPSQEHLPEHTGSRDKDSIAARVTHGSRTSGWTTTERQQRTPPREVRTFTPHVNPDVHGPLKTLSSGMSTGLISGSTKVPHANLLHTTTCPCPNSWRGTSTVYSVTTRTTTTRITCSTTCKTLCMTPPCTHGVTCVIFTGSCWG